jgi:hypothetical protein
MATISDVIMRMRLMEVKTLRRPFPFPNDGYDPDQRTRRLKSLQAEKCHETGDPEQVALGDLHRNE